MVVDLEISVVIQYNKDISIKSDIPILLASSCRVKQMERVPKSSRRCPEQDKGRVVSDEMALWQKNPRTYSYTITILLAIAGSHPRAGRFPALSNTYRNLNVILAGLIKILRLLGKRVLVCNISVQSEMSFHNNECQNV